jgi:acyl-CoA synthetase (AMP-forming)/AMP-acid ligase II
VLSMLNTGATQVRRDISGWQVHWNEDQATQWVKEGKWRNLTVADAARELARTAPERVTQVCGGREITAGEVWRNANALASALWQRGFRAGDVIAFQTPNWHEAAFIDIAACLLGLVVCPIVTIYRDHEVELILSDSRAKGIFVAESFRGFDYRAMVARLLPVLPTLEHVWTVRGTSNDALDLRDLIASAPPLPALPPVSPNAVKLVLYTSGTTGRPKAVLHSHNSLLRATLMCAKHWGIRSGDTTLMPSPVTHVTGFSHGLEMPFLAGTRCVLMEKWDAGQAADIIDREQVTFTIGATPFLQELMDVAEAQGRTLPSLRLFPCGGAAVAPETIYRVARVLPNCRSFRVYGSSEAPMITMGFCQPGQQKLAAETDGEIIDYEVRVVDLQGKVLAPGHEGEICARGPSLFLGYADPAHSAEAFDEDGFFHTGDIGYITDEQAVVFTGRIKDLINRGGEKISAKEVEDLLHQHPAVMNAAVVAMPHARLGEAVCAFVIPKPGMTLTADDLNLLLDSTGVAKQKYPEQYYFVERFPQTASGKVKKDLLREDARQRRALA